KRVVDNAGSAASLGIVGGNYGLTVLGRTITPRDSHSWAKVYAGADVASFVPTAFTSGSADTICNASRASGETDGYMIVLPGNFPDADATEGKQCFKASESAGTTYD